MRNRIAQRVAVIGATLSTLVMVGAGMAYADTATAAVTGGAGTLKDDLLSIATTVLPYAALVLAVTIGWRFAKKFVRG